MRPAPKVMLLVHPQMRPDRSKPRGATESDVWKTLRRLGYRVEIAALRDDLRAFDAVLAKFNPAAVFNLLEEFRDEGVYDFHPVSFLEAMGVPYTGCNPRGLAVTRNKDWAVHIAHGCGVRVPESDPVKMKFPALVKFKREHASRGLTKKSKVNSPKEARAVTASMARLYPGETTIQEFVRGEDVTVSVFGNATPTVLSPWRLSLGSGDKFATERIKFSARTRHKLGIRAYRYGGPAHKELVHSARRLYTNFDLSGYARLDFRVTELGEAYFIDVNANPNLAKSEDFACSAKAEGWEYPELIQKIVSLARVYKPRI